MAIAPQDVALQFPYITNSIPGGGAQGPNVTTLTPIVSGFAWGPTAGSITDVRQSGKATFTGDGASLTSALNFIDGTQQDGVRFGNDQPITPFTRVSVSRIGGTDTSVGVPYVTAITATGATINWTVAPANGLTQVVSVEMAA